MLGKKTLIAGLLVAAGFSSAARADGNTVLGAMLGGALGASIGHSVGGHDATVIGGVLGAAAGASIADSERYYYGSRSYAATDPYYRAPRGGVVVVDDPGYYAPPPVAYARAPVAYAPPPAVYVSGGYYRAQGYRYRDRDDRGWSHRHHEDADDCDWDRHGGYGRRDDGYGDDRGPRGRW